MKKLVGLALASLMVLMFTFSAVAETIQITETSPFFDLTFDAPDGTVIEQNLIGDISIVEIELKDKPGFNYMFTVAFDDMYTGRNMSDLSTEELDHLFESILGELDPEQSSYRMVTLDDGVTVMILDFQEILTTANVLTINNGYFLQMFGMYEDYTQYVNQADIDLAITLLDAFHLTAATK